MTQECVVDVWVDGEESENGVQSAEDAGAVAIILAELGFKDADEYRQYAQKVFDGAAVEGGCGCAPGLTTCKWRGFKLLHPDSQRTIVVKKRS